MEASGKPAGTGWGLAAHPTALSALLAIPLGQLVGPQVVWLTKRRDHPFVEKHAGEALNFNIPITIYFIVIVGGLIGRSVLLYTFVVPLGPEQEPAVLFVFAAFLAAATLFIGWLILTLQASERAQRGEEYRYPVTVRLIKAPGPRTRQ